MKKNLKTKTPPFAFSMRHLLVGIFLFASVLVANAQSKVIKGVVTDDKKIPLPGVSISIKGTKMGTQSDFDGRFTITTSAKDQLTFSYIGFETTTISVGNSSTLSVSLSEHASKLNEVVVVGYGTQKKANLTGAVSTLSSKSIENRPVTNLANALQGTMPGMNVTRNNGQPGGEDLNIQIRGVSSANGAVNPLLLVDGVATDIFNLQTINPSDVENISILKDGAAAAIYGAQAAGGVILVTTKKGKEGKTIFEFSNQIAIQTPLFLPERMSLFQEATMANLSRTNRGQGPEYSPTDMANIANGIEYINDPANANGYIFYNQKDYTKEISRESSIIQTHNFSARGGSAKTNYLFSIGHLDQEGMLKVGPDNFSRFNLRLNVGTELNKYLHFDSRISYSKSDIDAPSIAFGGAAGVLQQVYKARLRFPIYTPEGRLNGIAGTSGMNTYANLTQGGYDRKVIDDIDGNFQLTIKDIVEGLKLRAIYGHKQRSEDQENFKRTVTLWGKNTPIFYLNNPNSYTLNQGILKTENFQFLVDYNFKIGNNHKFTALAGYQWEDYRFSSLTAGATSLNSNDIPTLNLGDVTTKTNSQTINTFANQSLFSRFNYSYADKYLVELSIRSDESSRLAPGLRTKTFPSASLGWNISKEKWFANNLEFISELKPRLSWGQLGNANGIGYYDYINLINNNNNLVMGSDEIRTSYFFQSTIPSSALSWETVETYNYGVDFGFFKNKLTGSFDYYTKQNKNMLTPLRLPATFGVGTPKINNGVLDSWGWELAVNYRDKIGDDFNYGIGFNLSDNDNKLTSYAGISVIKEGTNTLIEGYPLNTIWGYQTKPGYINNAAELANTPVYSSLTGIGDIAYVDQNGDKKVNVGKGTKEDYGDLVELGRDQQQLLFGINANASWKNFDFSMLIQGVGKRSFMPNVEMIQPFAQSWVMPLSIHADYWTPANQDAAFPRPYLQGAHNFVTSDRWVLNGAYARLKNVQLGYALSRDVLNKLFFTKVRFYLSAENIATISKLGIWKSTFDPEQKNGTYGDYPMFGTVAFGVNLNF